MGPPLHPDDPADPLTPRPLYGGALTASLPARFSDVSAARPVPDHTEAWGDPDRDQSIVFEVVEHDPSLPDSAAAAFFFADQATQNEARASELTSSGAPALSVAIPSLAGNTGPGAAGASLLTCAGTQAVAKGRSADADALNTVDVALAILRLPGVGSDVLVVLNTGLVIGPGSSVAAQAGGAGGPTGAVAGASAALLTRVLDSLAIQDWGLFG